MAWEIELTEQVERWLLNELDVTGRRQIVPAIDELEEVGPTLGRPLVEPDHLIGGDKTDQWKDWYSKNIPIADDLYDEHLENI